MNEQAPLAVARRLSQLLLASADLSRKVFADIAEEVGVHVPVARALCALEGVAPMAELATTLACDKSYVTPLVGQMESLSLVTRMAGEDRRVKLLKLTARGEGIRESMEQKIAALSPVMVSLDREERVELERLLAKILTERPAPIGENKINR